MAKKSFNLYTEFSEEIMGMSDEEAGAFIKAVYAHETGEEIPPLKGAAKTLFTIVRRRLDENRASYEKKCEANRENGAKGGRHKANPNDTEEIPEEPGVVSENPEEPKETQNNPHGFSGNPKKADKDKDKDKDKETDLSVCLVPPTPQGAGWTDGTDAPDFDIEDFKDQVEYGVVSAQYPPEEVDELMCIVEDAMTGQSPSVKIGGVDFPRHIVQKRLSGLSSEHILHVLENRGASKGRIKNIKAYLLTMLYNAPAGVCNGNSAMWEHDERRRNG